MMRLALRSLGSRPMRTILTTLAILLGVAMITGTYVLTDQIDQGFTDIYKANFAGTAVQIDPKTTFGNAETGQAGTITPATLAKVEKVPGVARAAGGYQTLGAAIVHGKAITTGGAPTILTVDPGEPFSQATLVAGTAPKARNEVAIIKSFADDEGLRVGDTFAVAATSGMEKVRVSGVFKQGEQSSMGGAIVIAGRLQDVQRWGGQPGVYNGIAVSAEPGVKPADLALRIRAALPATVTVRTGEEAAAAASAQWAAAINSFLKPMLLAFAGISVFVGAFIIFNAFSITVAQRRREFAMLRALGASRRQILVSVVAEALTLGALASALGVAAGLGVAKGINGMFRLIGADIPMSGVVLEPRTVLIACVVGIGVTLLSALAPAVRATRVPPVAALQEGAVLPPTRLSRLSTAIAFGIAALGGAALAYGIAGDGSSTNARLLLMGGGALLLFVAVAMLSKYLVRPAGFVIGLPMQLLSPISGRLARQNADRNPSRTAATAAALMIGLAMVVFVAVFAQALKGSFGDAISNSTRAQLVVQDQSAYLTVPQKDVRALAGLPGVQAAAGAAWAEVKVKGSGIQTLYGVDPAVWPQVWAFAWRNGGSDALYSRLDARHVLLEAGSPMAKGAEAGDVISVTTQTGKKAQLTVLGFYRDQMAFSGMVTSLAAYRALDLPTASSITLVRSADGASVHTVQSEVKTALAGFPTQKVQTRTQYLDTVNSQIDMLLNLFYGLLAMAVLISILGIVNTLVLSVHERTRELGMLRAVGASRRQVKRMVRYESVITSVMGGILGTAVGVAMAYVMVTQMGGDGLVFQVPWVQLLVFLVLTGFVGVLAAVLPARRASRVRILEAIQYE